MDAETETSYLVRYLRTLSGFTRLSQKEEACCKDEQQGDHNLLEARHIWQH